MFPIPWNFPLRKKNGNLVNIGDAIEAGTEIPVHSASDAGKVLSVDTNGALEWSNEVPAYVEGDAGKLLSVDENGDLEWSNEVPQAIENLTNNVGVLIENGAVNYFKNTGASTSGSGVSWVVNNDGTVTVDISSAPSNNVTLAMGSFTFKAGVEYRLTGTPSGGGASKFAVYIPELSLRDDGDGVDVLVNSDTVANINAVVYSSFSAVSHFVLKPMVSDARLGLTYADFVPYAKTNQELTAENQTLTNEIDGGWYKGRNLCNKSNVSGTTTESVNLINPLPAGTYTLSAVVTSSDIDANTCLIYDVTNAATLGQIARSIGNSRVAITFTTANAIAEIRFYASNSYNTSQDDTFSFTDIQIEKGEIATKYVPYAMTNRELTELTTIASDTSTLFKYHKVNSIVTMQLAGQQTYADIKNLTIPDGFRPNSLVTTLGYCASGTSRYFAVFGLNPNGSMTIGKIVNNAFTTPSDTDNFEFSTCYYAGN